MPNPAKPIELKRRTGNPGKRALPEPRLILPAVADGAIPKPPRSLKKAGRVAWRRLWSVGPAWLSQTTDVEILTRLCEAYDEREVLRSELTRQVKEQGADAYFTVGSMGQKVINPLIPAIRQLEAQITRYESLCGFTPSDRSRLGMAEVRRVSKLEDFLARRGQSA